MGEKNVSNAFSSKFGGISKVPPNQQRNNALLSPEQARDAAASTFVKAAFTQNQKTVSSREVHQSSDVLGVYANANPVGDILGGGRKGHGLGLRRAPNGEFEVTRENVARALQGMSEWGLTSLLAGLSMTLDAIALELEKFPRESVGA